MNRPEDKFLEMPPLVLPPAEPERLPKGEPDPAALDRMFKAELKRRMRAAKRLKESGKLDQVTQADAAMAKESDHDQQLRRTVP